MLLLHKINTLVLLYLSIQSQFNQEKYVKLSITSSFKPVNFFLFHSVFISVSQYGFVSVIVIFCCFIFFFFHFGGRQVNKEANTSDDNFRKIAIVNHRHRCHKTSSDIVAKTVFLLTRFFSPFLCFLSPA